MKNKHARILENFHQERTEKENDADIITASFTQRRKLIEQRQPRATLEPGKVTSNARLFG